MAQFTERPRLLPDAVLDSFKYEIATELGLMGKIQQQGWPEMTTHDVGRIGGRIGGRMVRVMIRHAEEALAKGAKLT